MIAGFPSILRIDRDRGLGEMLNHATWLVLAVLSVRLFRRQGQAIFPGLALLSLVALPDDGPQWRERFDPAAVSALAPACICRAGRVRSSFG